jgi:hypothetical protein
LHRIGPVRLSRNGKKISEYAECQWERLHYKSQTTRLRQAERKPGRGHHEPSIERHCLYAGGQGGADKPPLAAIGQMQERMAALETENTKLRQQIATGRSTP